MSTQTPAFVKVLPTSSRASRYGEAERQQHCEAWRKSGLSMNQYCRQEGLAISTFSKWANADSQTALMPIASPRALEMNSSKKQPLEVILSNGLRVRFPEIVNMSDVLKLIQELGSCK